jgi:hypothetical protein
MNSWRKGELERRGAVILSLGGSPRLRSRILGPGEWGVFPEQQALYP